jgi:uncharacterized membrane protein
VPDVVDEYSILTIMYKTGYTGLVDAIWTSASMHLLVSSGMRSVLITGAVWLTTLAYALGGSLSMVQTILSFYVLITIVLSIVIYHEHWDVQKALAIVLSVVALAFFH